MGFVSVGWVSWLICLQCQPLLVSRSFRSHGHYSWTTKMHFTSTCVKGFEMNDTHDSSWSKSWNISSNFCRCLDTSWGWSIDILFIVQRESEFLSLQMKRENFHPYSQHSSCQRYSCLCLAVHSPKDPVFLWCLLERQDSASIQCPAVPFDSMNFFLIRSEKKKQLQLQYSSPC